MKLFFNLIICIFCFNITFGAIGGDFNEETHNREKPISQKTTHLLLYGGLGVVTLWIILNEIIHI